MGKTNFFLLAVLLLLVNCEFIFADAFQSSYSTFGNKWHSRQQFCIDTGFRMGVSGSKDFIWEQALFSYRFKSSNRHAFTIRTHHIGMTTGNLTGHGQGFDWAVMIGFEYLVKIFSNDSGFFVLTDVGSGNRFFTFYAALGVGSHEHTYIQMDVTYMLQRMVLSEIKFNVEVVKFFSILGTLGVDATFYDISRIDLLCFRTGFFLGFSARPVFTAAFGGGVTVNDYYAVGGFGELSLRWTW
ncbi:MAG: hypothetical protein IKN25_04705 [Spirochaetales bacterium]|nr:hypothetical protein [Spirochaetales bacterium]